MRDRQTERERETNRLTGRSRKIRRQRERERQTNRK
jgi:hypothetical protein